ncbi:amidase domain-containing protein [Paenibacillus glycanilyticus]|uniref:amidase domain-containing protein n=1 Tax=Paenibacillus glycanilyticus TaxID=126569 RepID=UPI00288B0B3F|nr:amidase domain-containing protein [Paenibacillus glycanilyticus]
MSTRSDRTRNSADKQRPSKALLLQPAAVRVSQPSVHSNKADAPETHRPSFEAPETAVREQRGSQTPPRELPIQSAPPKSAQPSAGHTAGKETRQKLSSLLRSSEQAGAGKREAAGEWKSAISKYVNLYNKAETDQHYAALDDFIDDKDHGLRLRYRLERLRERDLYRGVLPARGETKAELIKVNESPAEVSVLVKLHIKRQMEQSGLYYLEERTELERIWLNQSGGSWRVFRIEPVIAERRPRFGVSEYTGAVEEEGLDQTREASVFRSTPFLNLDLYPQLKQRVKGIPYRRELAAAYADRWWNEGNPAYEEFDVNCTNYISQCLFAGHAPMNYTGKRESGWWYKGRNGGKEWWSYSWAVSNALTNYLSGKRNSGLHATVVQSVEELQLGDVITYDWNGDNRYQHSTIITAFDAAGMPLVNANTVPSRHRFWDYRDSYAWTEQTRYRFFHIADHF